MYSKSGAVLQNAVIKSRPVVSITGVAIIQEPRTVYSNGDGLFQITNLIRGAEYEVKTEGGNYVKFTVPATATFELPAMIGESPNA